MRAQDKTPEDHAIDGFADALQSINKLADWDSFSYEYPEESLGKSNQEKEYRQWALDNRLFLNPLNDLGARSIAANDVLFFPSFVIPRSHGLERKGRPPEVYGMYNQLKQEYVSTRLLLYESLKESTEKLHFSDKRVKLVDTLDYRLHRLWIEKMKMAFLSAYAILDKIAYLINLHWDLQIPQHKINFRTIWYKSGNRKAGLRDEFTILDNWPLRGLFWLSKDIFHELDDVTPIDPVARQLHHIRTHIAHKYLTVHDIMWDAGNYIGEHGHDVSYPINQDELKTYGLKLLKLVRNALIYVSLGAHFQEAYLGEPLDDGLVGSLLLRDIPDEFR